MLCLAFFMRGGNNLKNSVVAGFIAGIISGIVASILHLSGLWELLSVLPYDPTPVSPQTTVLIEITWWILWGLIWGAFYSLFYDYIPSKGIKKGLFYGLILWIMVFSRNSFVYASYGYYLSAFLFALMGFVSVSIAYGITIGYLYKPKK